MTMLRHSRVFLSFLLPLVGFFGGSLASAQTPTPPTARTGKFFFGQGTNPSFQTFVIPLDFQKGVQLSLATQEPWASGQPYDYYPWFYKIPTTTAHLLVNNGGTVSYPLAANNPVAGFGSGSGGSSLFVGQSFRFALYAGGQTTASDIPDELKILVYNRATIADQSSFIPVFTHGLDIPHSKATAAASATAPWKQFGDSGFQKTFTTTVNGVPVLETTVQFAVEADASGSWGAQFTAPFILTHRALPGSEPYGFVVEAVGATQVGTTPYWMAISDPAKPATSGTHVRAYAMNFDQAPPWATTLMKTPSFQGEPAPPAYHGKTAEEILAQSARFDHQFAAPTTGQYTQLGQAAELQGHEILDKFVATSGNDPLTLVNFVHNEIRLTDALSYNQNGDVDESSVNSGGVNRGALATFQEGQGSPEEQCALLVYLLRKAGVQAAYVKPSHNAVKLLDSSLSKMLRLRLTGLQTPVGGQPVPEMIGVNYPWVSAYLTVDGQQRWVHLFPWLKDTEVVDGLAIEGYLPSGTKSIREWVRKYLLAGANDALWTLDAEDRTPGNIFLKDLEKSLQQNWQGLSRDNLGIRFRDRKFNRSQWKQFPQPQEFAPTGTYTASDKLSSDGLVFDTMDIEIASVQNTSKKITVNGLRIMDLHNRRSIVNFIPGTTDNFTLKFTMEAYDLNNPGSGTGDFGYGSDTYLRRKQEKTLAVNTSDKQFTFKVTYHRHRNYGGAVGAGDTQLLGGWQHFLGITNLDFGPNAAATASDVSTSTFGLGDLNAFCINTGRVTDKMLRVHLEPFWKHEQERENNTSIAPNYDLIQGTTAYLMGMSYYQRVTRSFDELKDLFKVHVVSMRAHGFAQFGAKNASDGKPEVANAPLTGTATTKRVNQIYPVVDMNFMRTAWAGYGDVRPDAGGQGTITGMDFMSNLFISEISALEDHTIKQYVDVASTDAVSTVNLIHRIQQDNNSATNVIELDLNNYLTEKTKNYTFSGTTKTLAAWAGTGIWSSIESAFNGWDKDLVRVYITPGPVSGAGGFWKGVGALIFGKSQAGALIGQINGGYGSPAFSSFSSSAYSFDNMSWNTTSLSLDSSYNPKMTPSVNSWVDLSLPPVPKYNPPYVAPASINYVAASNTTFHSIATNAFMGTTGLSGTSYQSAYVSNFNIPTLSNHWDYTAPQNYGYTTASSGWGTTFSDPVHSITGELYADELDLVLPGPIPLQVRRNYSSQSSVMGSFGFGWKMAYFPHIVPTDGDTKLQAAELDGSVIIYNRNTANTTQEEWTVRQEDNPQLTNGSGLEIGSVRNLMRNRIIRTVSGGITTYTLYAADGGTRVYEVKSYPVFGASPAINRQRPYLKRWTDSVGNYLDFKFYGDGVSGDPWYVNNQHSSYGQLARVQSSNGNYLGFNHDIYGRIVEVFTGDGRRVSYRYDEEGDLREVTLPDNAWAKYDYHHEQGKVGTTTALDWYSTHLIKRETRPGGRMVESDYQLYVQGDLDLEGNVITAGSDKIGKASHLRRVTQQRATVGEHASGENRLVPAAESYKPVRNGTYAYFNTKDSNGLITGRTEILDAYNRKTIYYYVNNRLTKVMDPLSTVSDATTGAGSNAKMEQQWWTASDVTNNVTGAFAGGLKSLQQRGSARTEFYYNSSGDVTEIRSVGDLDGDGDVDDTTITSATYNSLHLPELIVHPDPVTGAATGKRTRYYYQDGARPYLVTRVEQQDASGNVLSASTNTYHDVTSGAIFSKGLLQLSKSAEGTADESVAEWEHDARGFVTKQTAFSGQTDQVNYPNVVTEFFHNLRGEMVEEQVKDGTTTKKANRYAYDDMGRRIWAERLNQSGQQIAWDYTYYNLTGEVEWTDSSRSNPEDYTYMRYDGAGRPVEQVAWRSRAKSDGSGVEAVPGAEQYATTKFFYNQFGDLVKVMDPRGHTVRALYDDIGRKLATMAYQGDWQNGGVLLAQEQMTYDDAARKVTKIDAKGAVTQTWFTSDGRPRRQINVDQTELEWRYQLDGRVKREPLNAHVFVEYSYNDTNRTVTKTTKNADSQTLGSEVMQADRRGNAISATDIAGYTVTSTYDKLNRAISKTMPASGTSSAAQSSTYYYDAAGMRQKVVNALGESSETLTDALGRMLSSVTKDATNNVVSQSSATYSADFHGVTTTSGTSGNAMTQSIWTDTAGRTVLVKQADGTYRRTYYDAAGNAYSVTDENGQTTKMEYDGLNRVKRTILPDGAQTQFTYTYPSGGGQRIERLMPQNLTEVEVFDAAGRISEKYLSGAGEVKTRHYQGYLYYSSGKSKGLLGQFTDPRGLVHNIAYDDWLRVSTSTVGAPSTAAYVKKEFLSYDVRGMVTNLKETGYYAVTETLNSYDGQGHLVEEQVKLNGSAVTHLVNTYDAAGRRSNLSRGTAVATLGSGVGGNWGFGYRADGLMSQVSSGGSNFNYSYGDSGLLQTRSNPFRSYTVPSSGGRDNRGRLTASNTRLTGRSVDVVSEAIGWTTDSKQSSYSATRLTAADGSGTITYNDARSYVYTTQRRQLASESWVPGAGQSSQTQLHEHDYGHTGGLGIHTGSQAPSPTGGGGDQLWFATDSTSGGTGINAFGQVIKEVSGKEAIGAQAQGAAKGAKDLQLLLNDSALIGNLNFPLSTRVSTGAWSRDLWVPAGDFKLGAKATHPSGAFSADASVTFQMGLRHLPVETTYDQTGNVTTRTISGGFASNGRTQTLTWDGTGRLISVIQDEVGGYGFEWTAVYDGYNRRLQTTTVPKRNGLLLPTEQVVERSWYDPLVEFLEVGIEVTRGSGTAAMTERWWKVHGPDLSGGYGGLEGMGGLEAMIREETGEVVGMVDDAYGHVLGYAKATSLSTASAGSINFEWNSAKFGGYGPLPGSYSPSIGDGASVWRAHGWRGKRLEVTGFYHQGARYYEPVAGRFLSTDPLGHGASMSLYDYAGGDPINFVDPGGRSAVTPGRNAPVTTSPYVDSGFRFYSNPGQSTYNSGNESWRAEFPDGEVVGTWTPPAMQPPTPVATSGWDRFASAMSAAGQWGKGFGGGLMDAGKGALGGAWNTINHPVTAVSTAWDGMKNEVINWSSSVGGYAISLQEGNFWSNLGEAANEGFQQGLQDLGDGRKFGQTWG